MQAYWHQICPEPEANRFVSTLFIYAISVNCPQFQMYLNTLGVSLCSMYSCRYFDNQAYKEECISALLFK